LPAPPLKLPAHAGTAAHAAGYGAAPADIADQAAGHVCEAAPPLKAAKRPLPAPPARPPLPKAMPRTTTTTRTMRRDDDADHAGPDHDYDDDENHAGPDLDDDADHAGPDEAAAPDTDKATAEDWQVEDEEHWYETLPEHYRHW
jgi:hypothetical protein